MAPRTNEVLTFIAVPGNGGTATLPHHLNINSGVPVRPDLLFPDVAGFELVSADETQVTVKNNNTIATTLDLWLWYQHSIDRAYGGSAVTHLAPWPFWVTGGGAGSGSGGSDVVLTNDTLAALVAGTPVYSDGAGTIDKARANASGKSLVAGLVVTDIPASTAGSVRTAGPLTLSTAQWDARTGEVGGLTVNAIYYLDPTTAGKMTRTPPDPATADAAPLGQAVSATTFVVNRGNVTFA